MLTINSKQQKWGRFDLGPIWLGPIWLGADLVLGRFDLLPDKCLEMVGLPSFTCLGGLSAMEFVYLLPIDKLNTKFLPFRRIYVQTKLYHPFYLMRNLSHPEPPFFHRSRKFYQWSSDSCDFFELKVESTWGRIDLGRNDLGPDRPDTKISTNQQRQQTNKFFIVN